ncbi:hypothetical protein VCV18_000376 [Metarhizium anisopliae]
MTGWDDGVWWCVAPPWPLVRQRGQLATWASWYSPEAKDPGSGVPELALPPKVHGHVACTLVSLFIGADSPDAEAPEMMPPPLLASGTSVSPQSLASLMNLPMLLLV